MSIRQVLRVGVGVAVGLLMAVLPACGDQSPAGSGAGARSPEKLAAALVTEKELGDGWTILAPPETGDRSGVISDADRDKLPRMEFCAKASEESTKAVDALEWDAFRQLNLATATDSSQPTERESGDRTRPQHHIVFVQEFLMSGDAAGISKTYDALASGIRACWGEVTKYPDGEVGSSQALDVPAIGEARLGTRDIVTEPGPAGETGIWDIRNVIARDGDVLVAVTIAEITTPKVTPVIGDSEIEDILTTIAGKLS